MIKGPLEADGRLAAKNATKIRAALTQVTNFKSVFERYKETHPEATDNKPQDRARARAWIMLNVGFNNDALYNAIMHSWAEAYVLGQDAAGEWIRKAEQMQKSVDDDFDWANWKPGDRATALLVKPVGGFQRYLEQSGGASYFKKFDKETIEMLGTSLADAIDAGLDAEAAALLMKNHVGSSGRALTIAITEQNRAMSFSTIQRYKEAELDKMEWHVSDPCDKCAQNAGQVIEIGGTFKSGNTQPPAHPHCRCVLLPVIPGMEEEPIAPTTPVITETPVSTGAGWQKVTPERWVERQEALRLRKGLSPANENHLKIMRDQVADAAVILENGPHIIRLDKNIEGITEENLAVFAENFDKVYAKLPEWRRIGKDGQVNGYTLVISRQTAGGSGTLAYTYLGHDAVWFSAKDVKSAMNPVKDWGTWFMPAASTVTENMYTIAHELGHTTDSWINDAIRGKVVGPLRRKYPELWSRYSRENSREAYAEVFAQWLLGEQNPVTEVFAEKFGWNMTAQEYWSDIPLSKQWQTSMRGPGTV